MFLGSFSTSAATKDGLRAEDAPDLQRPHDASVMTAAPSSIERDADVPDSWQRTHSVCGARQRLYPHRADRRVGACLRMPPE